MEEESQNPASFYCTVRFSCFCIRPVHECAKKISVIHIYMHYIFFIDVNNDGFLDEQELEALFTKEVNKYM